MQGPQCKLDSKSKLRPPPPPLSRSTPPSKAAATMQLGPRKRVPDQVVQVVDESCVLQERALGPAGRAAGENDVGKAVGMGAGLSRRLAGVFSNGSPIGVQVDALC